MPSTHLLIRPPRWGGNVCPLAIQGFAKNAHPWLISGRSCGAWMLNRLFENRLSRSTCAADSIWATRPHGLGYNSSRRLRGAVNANL